MTSVNSVLLASTDPARLRDWYAAGLDPQDDTDIDGYLILKFGGFYLMIDRRADVGDRNPEPGRMILNFDVPDARAVVARLDGLGTSWLAELEDRDGSLFATAVDPDGNDVQVIELSAAHRAAMADTAMAEQGGEHVR
jgi:predicted enzyme related to lactoylglutathione lyase